MIDKINYKGEERIAIVLPANYTHLEAQAFGDALFEGIETIVSEKGAKDTIDAYSLTDLVRLARIVTNNL